MALSTIQLELMANVARLRADMEEARRIVSTASNQIAGAARIARDAIAAIGTGLSVGEFVRVSDAATTVAARVKLATEQLGGAANTQAQLYEIANRSRTAVESLADTYALLARGAGDLGLNQQRVLGVTETLGKAIALSGGSAESSKSALVQLGQALAAGRLRGEELNSVLEQAPRLAQALADGLGKPVGALKAMGEAGELTSQAVVAALERTRATIDAEFGQFGMTIGQALTVARNRLMEYVGGSKEAAGVTRLMIGAIDTLSRNLSILSAAAVGYAATKLSTALMAGVAAAVRAVDATIAHSASMATQRAATIAVAQAKVQETTATIAEVAATQAAIIAARTDAVAQLGRANAALTSARASIEAASAAGAQSAALAVLRGATTAATAADAQRAVALTSLAALGRQQAAVSTQLAAAQAAQTVAQQAATAATAAGGVAATVAARALGFLGGPIGAFATLLGVAASAWSLWSSRATDAEKIVQAQVRESDADITKRIDAQIEKLRERDRRLGQPQTDESSPIIQDAGALYTQAAARLQAAMRGVGEFEKFAKSTRDALLPALGAQVGEAYRRFAELNGLVAQDSARKVADDRNDFMKSYIDSGEKLRQALAEYDAKFKDKVSPEQYIADTQAIREKTLGADANKALKEASKRRKEILDAEATAALARIRRVDEAEQQADKAVAEQQAAIARAYGERTDASMKAIGSLAEEIKRQQQANEELGLSADQVAALRIAREELAIATLEEARAEAIRKGEATGELDLLAEQIALTRQLVEARRVGAARNAEVEAAKSAAEAWKRTAEQIEQGLVDSLFRAAEAGKGFFETLRDTVRGLFNNLVLRPVIQATSGGLGLSSAGSALAGGGGGAGSALSSASSLAGLSGMAGSFGSWAGAGLSGTLGGVGLGSSLSGASALATGGQLAGGIGLGVGAVAPYALAAYAAYRAIVSLTRRRVTGAGIEGTLGGESGFAGNNFEEWRRRLGGGGRNTSALDPSMQAGIADAATATRDAVTGYAQALGLPVEALRAYTQALRIDTRGLEPEEIQKKVEEAIAAFTAGLVGSLGAGLDQLAKRGESAADTLARLATSLTSVNSTLSSLGQALLAVGTAGGDAASRLLDRFGGADKFGAAASGYLQSYYSDAERAALLTRQLQDALAAVGLSLPATRAEFRRLVESQDLMTESGRAAYTALLQSAAAFDQVASNAQAAADAANEQARAAIEKAQQQARAVADAWTSIGDSLLDEVRRIRGELANDPGGDFQALLEAARRGDQAAAGRLPDAARAYLESARSRSTTSAEYAIAQARVAAGLEQVAGAAQGTAAAQRAAADAMSALTRPAPVLPVSTPQQRSTPRDAEIAALNAQIEAMRQELRVANAAIAANTAETARTLRRWDQDTLPPAYVGDNTA